MKIKHSLSLAVILLCLSLPSSFGIAGLTLSLQCTDVVLRWPSATNETYIVQYRPTLDMNDTWQTLTNSYPAFTGTNWTTFVHSNQLVSCSSGSSYSGGGSGSPPSPSFAATSDSSSVDSTQKDKTKKPKKEELPPLPWDPSTWPKDKTKSSGGIQAASGEGETVQMGFYRVFCPTPLAKLDVFGVEQGSASTQLNILQNDRDPDDNPILLSAVQTASHGEIEYSDDASVFLYTPTNTFYGLDTFSYSITNDVGGSNSASVFVFVNETGNSYPSAPDLEFTLLTNQTVIAFPILTNATDPDSNSLQLVVIEQPSRGTAATNGNGEMVYTRTSSYITQDKFFYVLTDAQGGFAKRSVTILPQDDDGDGIPDAWELQHGLNVTQNDAFDDGDNDGLPNLAEYKLDTLPSVADNPLNLENIATNQMFREDALIPVPLKSYLDAQPISLLIDGDRAGALLARKSDGGWYINWDPGFLTNGNYAIALQFQYNPVAQPPDPSSITGNTKSVVVTNEVIFSQLASTFSDYLVFDLQLASQTNYWRIELFDEMNESLGYFSGVTTNGLIQGAWDLTDGQGNQLAFSHIRTDFYTSAASGTPTGGTTRKARRWFIKQTGGIGDAFVVAWGWDVDSNYLIDQRNDTILGGVLNIIGNPGRDDEYFLRPNQNIAYGSTFRYDNIQDHDVLLNNLAATGSGNFFWFGHGSTVSIEGHWKKSTLSAGEVESTLQNKKHRSNKKKAFENKHPYRLVILNGCETYSADWANAFGIDFSEKGTTNDVAAYYQQGRQSQAFVGWTDSVTVPGAATVSLYHAQYAEALAYLFAAWMDGYSLNECLRRYADKLDHYPFSGHNSWRISGANFMWRTAP